MSNTANIRIYRVRENVDINHVISFLTDDLGYRRIELREEIQRANEIAIWLYGKENRSIPDWVGLFKLYLLNDNEFEGFLKHDFVMLFQCHSTDGHTFTFAIFGGAGYSDVIGYCDYTFGISVLEAVFDTQLNKIAAISEKGITGDILASRRFYRRARPIAYEDDFGKYYQTIDFRLHDSQIRHKFPRLAERKANKLRKTISISGSSSIQIRVRILFIELVLLLKDLAELMAVHHTPIFNKNLVPLDTRRDKNLIIELKEKVFDDIINYCLSPAEHPLDLDFCHRDFEDFYESACCQFTIHKLSSIDNNGTRTLSFEDIYSFDKPAYIREVFRVIEADHAYDQTAAGISFAKDVFKSIQVVTKDSHDQITTSGNFLTYLQREVEKGGVSYFLLDNNWYRLKNEFDSDLEKKYKGKISGKFKNYPFIHPWNGLDETEYNRLYNNQPHSFYLHLIKVDYIELCDALIFDSQNNKAYFIHVKDGIGSTIRDLTSQVHMAARIIEEEVLTQHKIKLAKLYDQALNNNRINPQIITKSRFLQFITSSYREYILAVHDDCTSSQDIKDGNFASRIAKFSLVEFASAMRGNDWNFSVCCIGVDRH